MIPVLADSPIHIYATGYVEEASLVACFANSQQPITLSTIRVSRYMDDEKLDFFQVPIHCELKRTYTLYVKFDVPDGDEFAPRDEKLQLELRSLPTLRYVPADEIDELMPFNSGWKQNVFVSHKGNKRSKKTLVYLPTMCGFLR